MTNDQKAEKIGKELDRLCKKYDCQIGVWLSWQDILANLDMMKKNQLDQLSFGLQIQLKNVSTDNDIKDGAVGAEHTGGSEQPAGS